MLNFKEIQGQDLLLNSLKLQLADEQVHHAYLFHGPHGVGKKATAKALAGALNCLSPLEEGDACKNCNSCLKIAEGSHPDFFRVIPRDKHIRIEQLRELQERLSYKHWEGKYKVALIEEADLLTEQAANSLLKILEEPPYRTIFILVTIRPQSLLPTILSRCQKLGFRPLRSEIIEELLVNRHGMAPQEARILAHLAHGSPSRALTMVEDQEFFREREEILGFCKDLAQGGVQESLEVAQALLQKEQDDFLELMGLWWRDHLVWQLSKSERLLVNLDLQKEIAESGLKIEGLKKALLELEKARNYLGMNVNRRLCMEVMALQINQALTGIEKGGERW